MINTNLPPILHRFRDIAFDRSKIAIFGYPSCVQLPRRRGSPGTISVKFSVDVNGWLRYQMPLTPRLYYWSVSSQHLGVLFLVFFISLFCCGSVRQIELDMLAFGRT